MFKKIIKFLIFIFFILSLNGTSSFLLKNLQNYPYLETPLWDDQNTIVVLGYGNLSWKNQNRMSTHIMGQSRVREAARLYYNCRASHKKCKIITTGGLTNTKMSLSEDHTESFTMKRELIELGVMETDIEIETKSHNTFQNAQFVGDILKQMQVSKIFLVTSGYHMKRSIRYFTHFQIRTIPAPADEIESTGESWLPSVNSLAFSFLALHEYLGELRYFCYEFFGLNK